MFLQHSRRSIPTIFLLAIFCLWPCVAGGRNAIGQQRSRLHLSGRIVARVFNPVSGTLNLKWQVFIFQVGSEKGESHQYLSKVEYEYTDADGPLTEAFFDYAKHYQLNVSRDPSCDESLASLSILRAPDERNSALMTRNLLQALPGAPADALSTRETLPCFILRLGGYRVLKRR